MSNSHSHRFKILACPTETWKYNSAQEGKPAAETAQSKCSTYKRELSCVCVGSRVPISHAVAVRSNSCYSSKLCDFYILCYYFCEDQRPLPSNMGCRVAAIQLVQKFQAHASGSFALAVGAKNRFTRTPIRPICPCTCEVAMDPTYGSRSVRFHLFLRYKSCTAASAHLGPEAVQKHNELSVPCVGLVPSLQGSTTGS